MKRFLAMICASVMVFSLAACEPAPGPAPVDPAPVNTPQPPPDPVVPDPVTPAPVEPAPVEPDPVTPADPLRVAVFYYDFSDVFISTVREAMDNILNRNGIEFLNYDSANEQMRQNDQVEAAIALGYNFLVVNLVTSGALGVAETLTGMAEDAGIPIVFFNRPMGLDNEEGPLLASYNDVVFVGTDAPEAGYMQGEMIGTYVVQNFDRLDLNGDGTISYAMLKGDVDNMEAIMRTRYAVIFANYELEDAGLPPLEFFDPSNNDRFQADPGGAWSAAAALDIMQVNFAAYNEGNNNMIELVIANNDGMAEGAITALQDLGFNLGDPDRKIPVFGVDATDSAQELIRIGQMTGTVKQDNVGMAEGIFHFIDNVNSGRDFLAGLNNFNTDNDIPKKIFIPFAPFTG